MQGWFAISNLKKQGVKPIVLSIVFLALENVVALYWFPYLHFPFLWHLAVINTVALATK